MVLLLMFLGMLWLPRLEAKVRLSGQARTAKQRYLMQTLAGRKEIKGIGGENIWWERFRDY